MIINYKSKQISFLTDPFKSINFIKSVVFYAIFFASPIIQAEKIPQVEVIEHDGVYQIKVVAVIDAPASYVREVLTDYIHIYRLNPSIIESEVLRQHDDGAVSVRTRVIGCAAYFCEELERVEKVRVLPSGDLHAEIIPELSQFKSGQTFWHIKKEGDHCEVTYLSNMVPDIYIPPVVGKFLIKRTIREEMQTSFVNLQKISSVLAERVWQENYQPANDRRVTEVASKAPGTKKASNAFGTDE